MSQLRTRDEIVYLQLFKKMDTALPSKETYQLCIYKIAIQAQPIINKITLLTEYTCNILTQTHSTHCTQLTPLLRVMKVVELRCGGVEVDSLFSIGFNGIGLAKDSRFLHKRTMQVSEKSQYRNLNLPSKSSIHVNLYIIAFTRRVVILL